MNKTAKSDPVRALIEEARRAAEVLSMAAHPHESPHKKPLIDAAAAAESALAQQAGADLGRYDAGLLSDFGGGNVEWWQDYIRAELDRAHDYYTSQYASQPAIPEGVVPASALRDLYRAYVRLLESGRDRIHDLGGACDAVDVMEAGDLDLRRAREVLAQHNREGA